MKNFLLTGKLNARDQRILDRAVAKAIANGGAFVPHECFNINQALVLCDETKTLRYCEGYISGPGSPAAPHAWVTLRGKIIDLTPLEAETEPHSVEDEYTLMAMHSRRAIAESLESDFACISRLPGNYHDDTKVIA